MSYLFDTSGIPLMLGAAERLLRDACTYERQLMALAASMEDSETAEVDSVRELSAAAHEHRQRVAGLVTHLIGHTNGGGPVRRALVVDDAEDNRDVAAAALEAAGFDVIGAANGLDAVIAAYCARPSIILMDITMPILDGLEATRLLKASDATRAINVIAYTAQPSFYQKAFASLFVAVLGKPVDPNQLITITHRFAA